MKNKFTIFLIGICGGIFLCLIGPLIVFATAVINMGATTRPGAIERHLAPWVVDRSRESRAPKISDPYTAKPEVLATGLDHYRENCVLCHGAPGVKPGELAKGLNPGAPHLQSKGTQSMTDGELFWTIKHGVRTTGMPAFGPTHTDEQIWKIVTFVRHLPRLSDAEKTALEQKTEEKETAPSSAPVQKKGK